MSLGLEAAGYKQVAHLEFDETAAASFALNFSPPSDIQSNAWARARDMTRTEPADLAEELGLVGSIVDQFDVLAAGLPCQAFARIGRSKLRSIHSDSEAYRNDDRAKLYQRFLAYVRATLPVAIIIENVPDILNFGGHNVPEEICDTLDELGYTSVYTLLNAAYYGVPQMRERLFLIAIDSRLGVTPSFPTPKRWFQLPAGYASARSVALKHIPEGGGRFVPPPSSRPGIKLPGPVSVFEALRDLPRITEHLRNPVEMRRRKVAARLPYKEHEALTDFAKLMRSWRGQDRLSATSGHVVRLTPRDFPIFGRMEPGGDYPHAHEVARQLFEEALSLEIPTPAAGSQRWHEIFSATVPPYDPSKFPNKWWKLDPYRPSRTLTAHMGKDTYSHIHWDSQQTRTVSVREAARLQSFPDSFEFAGSMNAAFRQIGNAVPPLLSMAVAETLLLDLCREPTALAESVANAA